jgi:hypothetical protein
VSDGTFRGRWIDEVFRTPLITDAVRVALLALASDMDDAGRVSVPRGELAGRLARSERRMDDRIKAAIAAGFLDRTSRGQKHQTAAYGAHIPGRLSTTPGGPAEDPQRDDPQRTEPISQRDDPQRTEKSQRDPRGSHRAILSATPGGRATYKRSEKVSDHGKDAVVVRLFNEEDQTPSLRSREIAIVDRFAEFWSAYPRKVGKPSGQKAWDKAMKRKADPEQIILAARRYATDPRRSASDIKYTAHPATWLNDERYLDEPEAPPGPVVDSRQQVVNDKYDRAMQRALDREAREAGTQ